MIRVEVEVRGRARPGSTVHLVLRAFGDFANDRDTVDIAVRVR